MNKKQIENIIASLQVSIDKLRTDIKNGGAMTAQNEWMHSKLDSLVSMQKGYKLAIGVI